MRTILLFLLTIVFVETTAYAALAPKVSDENNGSAAAFTIKPLNKDEKEIALADFKGKPVIVSFFATWCPPCQREVGELIKIHKEESEKGLIIVGAAVDSKQFKDTKPDEEIRDVKAIIKEKEIPYYVGVATDQIVKDYKFIGIPTTIFIDRDGKIIKTFYGYHEKDKFADALKTILSDKAETNKK